MLAFTTLENFNIKSWTSQVARTYENIVHTRKNNSSCRKLNSEMLNELSLEIEKQGTERVNRMKNNAERND